VLITLFYLLVGPLLVDKGYPGMTTLLLAEILILTPVALTHLFIKENRLEGSWRLDRTVYFKEKLPWKQYLLWSLIGIVLCFVIYAPLYPIGLFLRENLFHWLPEWYFNPSFGTTDNALIAKILLAGIFIDGIIGPTVEELFFRGYLLPRMAYLKNWAPIVNGTLFGLYHFWQPHNIIAIVGIGIVLSYIVWKKQNVYLGIIIHCTINILGAISGYLAATEGIVIAR
jgi:membrane protease YdiL (CAAX protease family)